MIAKPIEVRAVSLEKIHSTERTASSPYTNYYIQTTFRYVVGRKVTMLCRVIINAYADSKQRLFTGTYDECYDFILKQVNPQTIQL